MAPTSSFTARERGSVAALSGIYGLRMFGLFLLLPVMSVYASELRGATPLLMGLALGVYGMTQAALQIPYGLLSDRIGRKPVITAGLAIFAFGGLVAAASDHIWGVIVGRALQGGGAVAAAVLALAADLTRDSQRTKAMAIIGMTIGLAFVLALVLGPVLEAVISVPGIFLLTTGLTLLAICVLWWGVPAPEQQAQATRTARGQFAGLLAHAQLMRLNIGILVLHAVLTAVFVVVPLHLVEVLGWGVEQHWKIYAAALAVSLIGVVPFILLSSRDATLLRLLPASIALVLVAQLWMLSGVQQAVQIVLCLAVFFWGFNALEAMLPSLVSRVAPAGQRGTAIGIYNTFQYSGVFLGGAAGGWLWGRFDAAAVFLCAAILLIGWLILALSSPVGLTVRGAVSDADAS